MIKNQAEFVSDCTTLFKRLTKDLKNYDTTWTYDQYNIFSYASPKQIWTDLFRELRDCAIDFIGNDKDLCYQSWLNYHLEHQLLDWHDHEWPYHGELKDGINKPKIDISEEELDVVIFNSQPGEAIIFNDQLLHGGAVGQNETRVSLEFTMFVKNEKYYT